MQACPSCGTENAETAKFCSECGAALAVVQPTRREERKVVTVVFADLVGSTARAERLDPEDVRAILTPYHERLRHELERHGGTVEKFIGDAVVGVFGAPVAHEDDPERAVRSALAIQEAIADMNREDPALALEVRIGVATGEALVALDARPELGEGMVSGDVMNTCARLQSAAPPGGVLVGEETFRATDRAIEYAQHEPVSAKGKSAPLPVWLASARRASFGIDLDVRPHAPLVGRAGELNMLAGALSRVRERLEPELVTLVGVPGIGKSRLVQELMRVVDEDEELITWRQGRSLPYGEGVALWSLGEIVKAQAGVLESDGSAETGAKLASMLRDLIADEQDAIWVERHLRRLVGIHHDAPMAESSLEEAFAAWRRFLEALAEFRPTVLVFEDLHWADDGLLDFVDSLAERVSGVPLLVVCSARPELLERRPGWGGGKRNATTVSLVPLSDEDTARLLGALLGSSVLLADTQLELLRRAGGIPLFAEEYARMQQTGGGAARNVPATLQGIVTARIDGLPAGEKSLLQAAAILGKVFWTDALGELSETERAPLDELLFALERKEFVRRERRSAVAGARQYAFVHALVRDAAYGQVPRAERSRLHRRAAEWIETLPPDRSEDRAEMLAHHWVEAFELARSAGLPTDEMQPHAAAALREAGDRAFALSAFAAAARSYASALELEELDARRLLAYGRALHEVEFRGEDEYAKAAESALAAGDLETAAEAVMYHGEALWQHGRRDEAFAQLDHATALVADSPPSASKAFVTSSVSRFLMLAGRSEEAIRIGGDALAMSEELGLAELRAHALNNIGVAKVTTGDSSGLDDLRTSIEITRGLNSPDVSRGLINLASLTVYLGDVRGGELLHRDALEVAQRFGLLGPEIWSRAELAVDAFYAGRWDEAAEAADLVINASEQAGRFYMEVAARYARAGIRLARGDLAGALADAASTLEQAEGIQDPQVLLPALAHSARLFVACGRRADAETHVARLLDEVAAGSLDLAHEWVVDLAMAMAGLNRRAEFLERTPTLATPTRWLDAATLWSEEEYIQAAIVLDQIGALPFAAEARLKAAELLVAEGRRSEADEQLDQALAFFRSVGATRFVREGEALLEAAG
jgi:class 3 adenylate cyclase/tetratricopeptide (TPR) repeat protein